MAEFEENVEVATALSDSAMTLNPVDLLNYNLVI